MKILAFSDNHASFGFSRKIIEESKGVDALLSAGDFTHFGQFWEEFLDKIASLNLPLYLVSGNHELSSNSDFLKQASERYSFVRDLENRVILLGDTQFFGCSYLDSEEGISFFTGLSREKTSVFVTHCPPSGCLSARNQKGQDGGSSLVREFVEEVQPDLVLCGHIHDPMERESVIGESRIINLACRCRVFEF